MLSIFRKCYAIKKYFTYLHKFLKKSSKIATNIEHSKSKFKFCSLCSLQRGDLPLFTAIEAGNGGLVKELLFHHAKEQVRDTRKVSKDTALHIACWKKDTNLAKVLVEAGSIVDGKNVSLGDIIGCVLKIYLKVYL